MYLRWRQGRRRRNFQLHTSGTYLQTWDQLPNSGTIPWSSVEWGPGFLIRDNTALPQIDPWQDKTRSCRRRNCSPERNPLASLCCFLKTLIYFGKREELPFEDNYSNLGEVSCYRYHWLNLINQHSGVVTHETALFDFRGLEKFWKIIAKLRFFLRNTGVVCCFGKIVTTKQRHVVRNRPVFVFYGHVLEIMSITLHDFLQYLRF